MVEPNPNVAATGLLTFNTLRDGILVSDLDMEMGFRSLYRIPGDSWGIGGTQT